MSIDSTTEAIAPARHHSRKGRTVVKSKALTTVASQVTADSLGVNARNVTVSIHDDGSRLGLSVQTPLSEADVMRCSVRPDMTIFSLCDSAREKITERAAHITGHAIGDVDVIIDGVEKTQQDQRRVQ